VPNRSSPTTNSPQPVTLSWRENVYSCALYVSRQL